MAGQWNPLIMDNTAAPVICRTFDHGAAINVYSMTKYIGSHGTSVGGIIVDSGTFDWESAGPRQPALNSPDDSYHGAICSSRQTAWANCLHLRASILLRLGFSYQPAKRLIYTRSRNLTLRMREHKNASAVADYLCKHKKVARVIHPSNQSGEESAAQQYLNGDTVA